MPNVFLSHSHADKSIARRLAHDLRVAGVTVWLDEAELGVGDKLIRRIGDAIDSADYLAVLLSYSSVESEWVLREVEVALADEFAGKTVEVLPLLVRDCEVPAFLRGKVYADFRCEEEYQTQLARVLDCLGVGSTVGTTTVVFDESYQQNRWYAQPIIEAGYSAAAAAISDDYNVTSNDSGYSNMDHFPAKGILVLPMPYGILVDDKHYENIAKWVNRGGRLVILGLYLMEAHHYSNLNGLARRLGFEFTSNLTMPVGCEDFRQCMDQAFAFANRDYWIVTTPKPSSGSGGLLEEKAKEVEGRSTTSSKPRVFVGSSVEGLDVARAIQAELNYDYHIELWNQSDVFRLGTATLEALESALDTYDYAIFVFTPDDQITKRDKETNVVRDNVIFEAGLFIGRKGRLNAFIVHPRDLKIQLPSDLLGITTATYEANAPNIKASVGAACGEIRSAVK